MHRKPIKKSKAGLTRSAMASLGVSGDDVPKKDGTKQKNFLRSKRDDRGELDKA